MKIVLGGCISIRIVGMTWNNGTVRLPRIPPVLTEQLLLEMTQQGNQHRNYKQGKPTESPNCGEPQRFAVGHVYHGWIRCRVPHIRCNGNVMPLF